MSYTSYTAYNELSHLSWITRIQFFEDVRCIIFWFIYIILDRETVSNVSRLKLSVLIHFHWRFLFLLRSILCSIHIYFNLLKDKRMPYCWVTMRYICMYFNFDFTWQQYEINSYELRRMFAWRINFKLWNWQHSFVCLIYNSLKYFADQKM